MNLRDRVDLFKTHLENCTLCPRECGVNRLRGEIGFCKAGARLKVASCCLHHGEEPPVSGTRGSGTIFFSHCTMRCAYCQNYPISALGHGNVIEVSDLVGMMLDLERRGAHNINLVTATHYLPQVVEAIAKARGLGLTVPVVSNTSGYESTKTVRMLEDIVQIYLVDMRYAHSESAGRYSNTPDYPSHNRAAVRKMIDVAGPLLCHDGLAVSGVIIRHLLLPSLLEETREILRFVSNELPSTVPVSLMTQYFPANTAIHHPAINRKVTRAEYRHALDLLEEMKIDLGWVQDPDATVGPVA